MNTNTAQSVPTPIMTIVGRIRSALAPFPTLTGDPIKDLHLCHIWGYRTAVLDCLEEEEGILSEIAEWTRVFDKSLRAEYYEEIDSFIQDSIPEWAGACDFETPKDGWEAYFQKGY